VNAAPSVRGRSALLADAAATRLLGRVFGGRAEDGDVLALCGPLGAGKTTFVQGLAEGLDVPPGIGVRSPSFALCNEVPGRLLLLHADLYRISAPEEAEDLGFRERVGSEGLAVVEWADRFPDLMPPRTTWLRLDHEDGRRRVWVCEREPGDLEWLSRVVLPDAGGKERWEWRKIPPPWGPRSSPLS
jgi:tRNA threonylcarbamoyladenosine biosynthesis protein TsaE